MTVELRPLGVRCNIQCQYCYQNPQRDAGNISDRYDMERMKSAVEREGGGFSLFGGEALLLPETDLEALWAWGLEKYGSNGIQTNGSLINENHIRLFKQYNVHVGISIDGPGELNDVRWAGTLERTREMTTNTERAIERLCQEGIPPSLIVTLHRCNATADKLPLMQDWFRYLESIGITSARLHILEVENEIMRQKYVLTTEENVAAFLSFAQLEQELKTLKFDIFTDMQNLLLGADSNTTCIWNACDPYTTPAVRGVEGNGQSSNCGRTNKDGIDFTKADTPGLERYIALYHTPQKYGGCHGCRFFLMCKGNCPGTSIAGDWRNRSEHCEVWKQLYGYLEAKLIDAGEIPLSIRSLRYQLEQVFLTTWATGHNTNLVSALHWLKTGNSGPVTLYYTHGDHTDYAGLQPETSGAVELSAS